MPPRVHRSTTPPTTTPNAPAGRSTTPEVSPGRPDRNAPGSVLTVTDNAFDGPRAGARAGGHVTLAQGLFLSKSGYIVTRSGQDKPATPIELGDALTRAAALADGGVNVFTKPGVTFAHKEKSLGVLTTAFATGADPSKFNGNKDQALQTRASAGPLLLDLAKSLDATKPAEKALLDRATAGYLSALESEPHGQLRTFMLYDLDRAKGALPAELRPTIDSLMREVAPLAPPYEEWFKDGNTGLKLDYYVGYGFWEEELDAYTTAGFTRTDNPDGTLTLKRHYERERRLNDGTTQKYVTDVELVMHNGPAGMFEKMGDPTTAIVAYTGHADYGREIPSHLPNAPAMNGAKAFFALQCGGKGVHNALVEKYPDLQVVASRNSSYGFQDRATMLNSIEGIAQRLPWSQISAQNSSRNCDNYYFPSDTLISRRTQDRDHDGRVDPWDRVLTVNPFHPQADIDAQLTAKDPGKRPEQLDGRALTGAVLRFWRMAGYNEWAEDLKDEGVLGAGYYAGKKTDPAFKVEEVLDEDGRSKVKVQVNSQFAHASEEILGAALHYELGRRAALKEGLSEPDAKAAGLLMAAKALDIDTSYNDDQAFKAVLKWAGLPQGITHGDAMLANHQDEHFSAGSTRTLATFKETLRTKGISLG